MSAIMDSLPPALRLDLACAMNHSLFAKVRAALAASLDEGVVFCEFPLISCHSAV